LAVAANGVGELGDGPGFRAFWGLACLTPRFVCIGIAFSPCIVAVVCLIRALLSETDNNEEGIEKVFDKSLWRANKIFLSAFHKMLLLIDCVLCGHIIIPSLNTSVLLVIVGSLYSSTMTFSVFKQWWCYLGLHVHIMRIRLTFLEMIDALI
jgi:hypothetical protein